MRHCSRSHVMHTDRHMTETILYTVFLISHLSLDSSITRHYLPKAGIESTPTTWAELDAACAKLKDAGITPITADDAYLTSSIGYHLARYIGQDGVKSLVTGEEYNGESVTGMMKK